MRQRTMRHPITLALLAGALLLAACSKEPVGTRLYIEAEGSRGNGSKMFFYDGYAYWTPKDSVYITRNGWGMFPISLDENGKPYISVDVPSAGKYGYLTAYTGLSGHPELLEGSRMSYLPLSTQGDRMHYPFPAQYKVSDYSTMQGMAQLKFAHVDLPMMASTPCSTATKLYFCHLGSVVYLEIRNARVDGQPITVDWVKVSSNYSISGRRFYDGTGTVDSLSVVPYPYDAQGDPNTTEVNERNSFITVATNKEIEQYHSLLVPIPVGPMEGPASIGSPELTVSFGWKKGSSGLIFVFSKTITLDNQLEIKKYYNATVEITGSDSYFMTESFTSGGSFWE